MNAFLPQVHRLLARCLFVAASVVAFGTAFAGAQTAISQPLTCNPCSLNFGSTSVSSSKKMSLTLKNSGSTSLKITRYNKSAPAFRVVGPALPLTLAAGQAVALTIAFEPTATGTFGGKVWIENTKAWIGLRIVLAGTGGSGGTGSIAPNPSAINFGTVPVGGSVTQYATIKNTGSAGVKLLGTTVTGTAFSISGLTLPITLSAGQSVTFTTKFAPKVTGTATGSVSITSSVATAAIQLTGTGGGTGSLSATPPTLNFGTVTVGSSASLSGTINASGAALQLTSFSTGSSEFTVSGITLPFSLAAGQSVSYTVKFTPAASGTSSATLRFNTATGVTATESLSGTGAAAAAHSVSLSWNPSSSAAVIGYNVYRGTVSGGPYTKINTAVESGTNYGDTNVAAGKTYFYVVTSMDGGGNESSYSNQVKALIPSP